MAVNYGPLDFINNMTRAMMDDTEYMSLLAQTNTALFLLYQNTVTQGGNRAVANVLYKDYTGEVVSTGQAEYKKDVDNPHATGVEQMVMYKDEVTVDGFDFESLVGRDLESVISGGMIPRAQGRAFVNAYANEIENRQGAFTRGLNHIAIHGGAVAPENKGQFGGDRFIGLKDLASSGSNWGNLPDLGNHNFNGFDGNPQPRWAPVTKEGVGALDIGADGDLALLMTILNHGGSQIRPSRAFQARYVGICSQVMRNKIIAAWGDQVRRPLAEGSGLNVDITGARRPLMFEEFNLMIYPETDIDDETIIVWNPACIRLAENNSDRRYVKSWFLSTTNYTATLPLRKRAQLWCCDQSQIGMLGGITSVTRT